MCSYVHGLVANSLHLHQLHHQQGETTVLESVWAERMTTGAPLVAVENGLQGIRVKLESGLAARNGSIMCSITVTTLLGTQYCTTICHLLQNQTESTGQTYYGHQSQPGYACLTSLQNSAEYPSKCSVLQRHL